MRQVSFWSKNGRRAAKALVGLAFLTTLGCDNSMSFNPAAPQWPDWSDWAPVPGNRSLQIHGTLEIQEGAVLEATVLYDGQEVPGARSRCPNPAGCAELELEASVLSASGQHTISFQVVRQSQGVIDYRAAGTVLVSHENVNLGGVPLPLGPTHATLEAGGAVDFEVQLTN